MRRITKKLLILAYGLWTLAMLAACTPEVEKIPLYRQYEARKNLTVAQVAGFQLCDTVKVDVVILVADDSTTWQGLKKEFDIRTSEGVTSWMGDIDEPANRVKRDVRPAWRTMAVHADRTIAFYRIEDSVQYQALLDYQMDELEKVNR